MKQVRSTTDVKQLGTILGVWAHPDDETFTCGALLAAAVENGQTVICLTATRGEAGVQDEQRWPAAQLGDIRARELEAAMKVLGVKHHYILSYQDGCCWEADFDEAIGCICEYVERYKPDTILTFGPEGMTGHPDHQTVCTWAKGACAQAKSEAKIYHAVITPDHYEQYLKPIDQKFKLFYNIVKPPIVEVGDCAICFEPSDVQRDKKYRALQAMPSQFEKLLQTVDKDLICNALTPEAFVRVETEE